MNPALTLKQANTILDIVLEAGIYEPPKPTEPDAILKSAAEVIRDAETARRAGVKSPAVIAVLDLASPLQNIPALDSIEDTEPAVTPNGDLARWEDESPAMPPIDNDSSEDTAAVSTDAKLLESDQEQESSLYNPTDDIPPLPRDFSKVSDLELRSLHATRYGVLSKVIHELGLEESDYQSAQLNRDQEFRQAKTRFSELQAHARVDAANVTEEVRSWDEKVDRHHKRVIMLRSYKVLLMEEIKGLSREYTMRTGERTSTP